MRFICSHIRTNFFIGLFSLSSTAGIAAPVSLVFGQNFNLNNGNITVPQILNQGRHSIEFSRYYSPDDPDQVPIGGFVEFTSTTLSRFNGTGFDEIYGPDDLLEYYSRLPLIRITYNNNIDQLRIDNESGKILESKVSGKFSYISKYSTLATGGELKFNNLWIDWQNRVVRGDLDGIPAQYISNGVTKTPTPPTPLRNAVLWTFDAASGPTQIPISCWQDSTPSACFKQAGWSINPQGRLAADIAISSLTHTPELAKFLAKTMNMRYLSEWSGGAPYDWGSLTLALEFGAVAGNTPIPSGETKLPVGEIVETGYKFSGGTPIKIQHIRTAGTLTIKPSSLDMQAPGFSMQGWLAWLNLFYNMGTHSTNVSTVLDPRIDPSLQYSGINSQMIISSSGQFVGLNISSGEITGMSGFSAGMRSDLQVGAIGGGEWVASDISYPFNHALATGAIKGMNSAIGSTPARALDRMESFPLWTYSPPNGPLKLPLSALASAANASAIPDILRNAGFTIRSVSSQQIIFQGLYTMNDLSITESLKDFSCNALNCTSLARGALLTPNTNFIGDFKAISLFSIPLQ